jgi:hypothetical protein
MYKSFLWNLLYLNLSIKKIVDIFKEHDISFCIIGGAARFKYKVNKMTDDVAILVDKKDKDKIKNIPIGYLRDVSSGRAKVFNLHVPQTKVEVIYSDEVSGDGIHGLKYPLPTRISKNIGDVPYINLIALIQFKLSAGIYGNRLKDFSDIVDLICANNLSRNYAKNFRKDLTPKYEELWDSIKNI